MNKTIELANHDPVMMIPGGRQAVLSTLKAARVGSKWVLKPPASTNPPLSFILRAESVGSKFRHQGVFAKISWPYKAIDKFPPAAQVLFENLPVALAAVDCEGTEASITECQSNDNFIGECTNITSSTVLACANSAGGMSRAVSKHTQM